MWATKETAADGDIAMETIVTGDLVIDGKQLSGLLGLAKHLVEEKQAEFVDEMRPLIDVGIIIENQGVQREDGCYAFVHWPDGHIEPRHTRELVKVENMEAFIKESLIWHV